MELKIKPFDINEWKVDFAKRHNLEISYSGAIFKGPYIVINRYNNTSFSKWHDDIFSHKHKKFNLSSSSKNIFLKTEEDCEEFERIYTIIINYLNYLNNIPNLNKEENNEENDN